MSLLLHGELRRILHDRLGGDGAVVADNLGRSGTGQPTFRELVLHEHRDGIGLDRQQGRVHLGASLHNLSIEAFSGRLHNDVADPMLEGDDVGLVLSREELVIALTIFGRVLLGDLANLDDGVVATRAPHGCHGEVRVAACAVPVTLLRLWVDGADAAELLGDAEHQGAGHGQVVTHLDATGRANLELPVSRHDLSVGARDLDAGLHAHFAGLIGHRAADGYIVPCAGVAGPVGALGCRLGHAEPQVQRHCT